MPAEWQNDSRSLDNVFGGTHLTDIVVVLVTSQNY
jgi:hypothetical protein